MQYNKKDFVKLFKELGIEDTEDMFVLEPETTMKKLQALEERFNINTKTALKINDIIGDPNEPFSEWTTLFYKYEAYGGSEEMINTISDERENLSLRLRDGLVSVEKAVSAVLESHDNEDTVFVQEKTSYLEEKRGPFSPLLFLQ